MMHYLEVDNFRAFPDDALARCRNDAVVIRENGQSLGVLIHPDLYELFRLYEEEHWRRPKGERATIPFPKR